MMSSVLIAAKKSAHRPNAFTANILSTWLQQHSSPADKSDAMSQTQGADQSGPSAKRMKSNDPAERSVVAANDEQQWADIFKLNVDCFEELFDYLSLEDLAAIGQTCKRMQRIAGHCFQLNYGAAHTVFYGDHFEVFDRFKDVKIDCFNNFFQNVVAYNKWSASDAESSPYNLMNFLALLKNSTSIKKIKMHDFPLKMDHINEMKEILSKAESVTIIHRDEIGNVFDALINACFSNVKYLSIKGDPRSLRNKDQFLHRIYPSLEHFELMDVCWDETPALITLFELNTTIKQFSVDMKLFWSNRELFKNSNIQLDILAIDYEVDGVVEFDLFCHLLNELYERGFYKKMHLVYCGERRQEYIDQLASVKGLVKLRFKYSVHDINLGALRNLEEIRLLVYITDMKSLPNMLPNLKRIDFAFTVCDDVLPFVRHAKKLNKIRFEDLYDGPNPIVHVKILDLIAWNKEREKLVGAHKITIYVDEDVYLATKWAMKQTDFKLIEMKRRTSYKWDF